MRTTVNRYECDRCGLVETHPQGGADGGAGWMSFYKTELCVNVTETNSELLTICASCCVELKAIRELGHEMVDKWFNERDRSKTS